MKCSSKLYLQDMLASMARIEHYTKGYTEENLLNDEKTCDAVLRNLEIIGEAASQLPPEVTQKYPEIPWRDIQDFRIVVAHHYWKIQFTRVWDIIATKLAVLRRQIENIVNEVE